MGCLICKQSAKGDLCYRHSDIFIYDKENDLFRKKKRLTKGARRRDKSIKFHKTERKLAEILRTIYGRSNVITSVHPRWAKSLKGALLEYDIAVPEKRLLIEYNGIQHYEYPNFFHKTKRVFIEQQQRDRLKQRLAKIHGWTLMIVRYDFNVCYGDVYEALIDFGVTA